MRKSSLSLTYPPACSELEKHTLIKILLEKKSIGNIGFSVGKSIYSRHKDFATMPDNLTGHILQWNSKAAFSIRLHFNFDDQYDSHSMR